MDTIMISFVLHIIYNICSMHYSIYICQKFHMQILKLPKHYGCVEFHKYYYPKIFNERKFCGLTIFRFIFEDRSVVFSSGFVCHEAYIYRAVRVIII